MGFLHRNPDVCVVAWQGDGDEGGGRRWGGGGGGGGTSKPGWSAGIDCTLRSCEFPLPCAPEASMAGVRKPSSWFSIMEAARYCGTLSNSMTATHMFGRCKVEPGLMMTAPMLRDLDGSLGVGRLPLVEGSPWEVEARWVRDASSSMAAAVRAASSNARAAPWGCPGGHEQLRQQRRLPQAGADCAGREGA